MDFETLANRHKDAVYRQMLRVCGNREDAEDVLIEALFKAYRHLDQLHDSVAFQSWLAQIARRVCWQLKKQNALMPLLQLSAMESGGAELADLASHPEAELASREMKRLLFEAVGSLPPDYRSVYELRDIQELPGEQVAAQLGLSLAAMKSRLHRARALLRAYLDAALVSTAARGK